MISADAINASFEALGGFVILLSVIKLHREKVVRGINPWTTGFFAAWGVWNLAFYPALGQWLSFCGGLFIVVMNTIWFVQLYLYSRKEIAPCPYSADCSDPKPISL